MWTVVVWMALAAMLCWQPVARAEPPTDASAYALLAIERATVGAKARVQGDAGSVSEALSLGNGTRITGAVAAPSVTLGKNARVAGGFFCITLEGATDGCMPFPNPLVATPTIVLVGPPSNTDVSAARKTKGTTPLAAGTYGALTIEKAAEMSLAGGTYQFESITLAARAKLLCRAACVVTVRGRVTIGQATQLGAGDGVAPGDVVLRIAAQDESTAFEAKSRARLRASVYAPSGEVTIGSAAKITGGLVGSRVTVGSRARLQGPANPS